MGGENTPHPLSMEGHVIVEKPYSNVNIIRIDGVKSGWEQWFMLRGDTHHDSVYCNTELEKKHLDMAKERNAGIIDVGDCFDAMQGREDRRRLRSELKMRLATEDAYYDALVEELAEYYKPYAKNFCVLGMGNHEASVLKHAQTNLTKRLACELNKVEGAQVNSSGFNGWVRFQFKVHKTKNKGITLYYDHGKGGNAPVTRGVIQTNRMSVYVPDADIVLSGHNHNSWVVHIKKLRLSNQGRPYMDIQHHVKVPSYKDAWAASPEYGFDIEKGEPKPIGCYWLRFFHDADKIVDFEITPAVT